MSTTITAPSPPAQKIGPTKRWTTAEFDRPLEEAWTLDHETPIALRDGDRSQPEITVLIGPRFRSNTRVPSPSDVFLLEPGVGGERA